MKSLKASQSSAYLMTCSLQEMAASWLLSHAANMHGASSSNFFPFSSCARSVMLHSAETWAMKADTLIRNDPAMIRWICNVKAKDKVSTDSLLKQLGI